MPPRENGLVRACVPLVFLGLLALFGCQQGESRPWLAESPTPLIAGQRWMAPIVAEGPAAGDRSPRAEPDPLRLADGSVLASGRVGLVARARPSAGWLESAWQWARHDASPGAEPAPFEMLTADLPAWAVGQSLWYKGRRLPAYWIFPDAAPERRPARLAAIEPRHAPMALALVRDELDDPRLRWRALMALERLGVEPPPAAWADPLLHDWAAQQGARWRAAMHRLAVADEALADQVLRVMTRWLHTPEGPLPAWPTDAAGIDALVLEILLPQASDEMVRRAARAYVEPWSQWLAWVVDDAGGIVGGVLAVANLGPNPALLSTRAPGGVWEAHGMLEPERMALVPAPAGEPADGLGPVTQWEVRLGGRTRTLDVTTGGLPLVPPGVTIGPFWHDWTLGGLARQQAASPAQGGVGWIAALVHRDTRTEIPSDSTSGWALYCEVRSPPCAIEDAAAPDVVTVAFGPTDAPRAVVAVRCTGLTTFEQGPAGESVAFVRGADRWAFTLPIDKAWLESDGALLLGVQWQPDEGPRATWPRPLLPNQHAPGRARIDPGPWAPAILGRGDDR